MSPSNATRRNTRYIQRGNLRRTVPQRVGEPLTALSPYDMGRAGGIARNNMDVIEENRKITHVVGKIRYGQYLRHQG
jgi:hypothetical protein